MALGSIDPWRLRRRGPKSNRRNSSLGLLEVIARDQVPDRPGQREPRAVKRRPKPYQLLNRLRRLMKELQHRSKYRKNRALI